MNILVIGGQGFIGQYLVNELAKDTENKITVVSRKINPIRHAPICNALQVKTLTGFDVQDFEGIKKYFENQDVVFNLAGYVSFKKKDKKKLLAINYKGALNVMRACEEMKIKKLVHLASTAALGFSDFLIDETHSFSFEHSRESKCIYSASKAAPIKHIVHASCEAIVIYPSLVLGPGDKESTFKLITALKEKKIPWSPPGSNSIVDVRDLARALVFLQKSSDRHCEYIVAGGSYSFSEINKKISKALNVKPPKKVLPKSMLHPALLFATIIEIFSAKPFITYENMYLSFKDRKHDLKRLKEAGFKTKYSLDQTIIDSVNWVNSL